MRSQFRVNFKNMDHSDAIEEIVAKKVEKLEHRFKNLLSCEVVIEVPHHHSLGVHIPHVNVHVKMREGELMVNREPEKDKSHADINIAIRDAFKAMEHQMEKAVGKVS